MTVDNADADSGADKTSRPMTTVEVLQGDANDAARLLADHNHAVHVSSSSSKDKKEEEEPIWYLAYGSNLCSSVFKGRRKIAPLQQCNVFVPGLELVFDFGGLPFLEPRFANARTITDPTRLQSALSDDGSVHYAWEKPWTGVGALLGVAYLVTPADFGKILASEGGGAAYKMVATDAYALACDAHPAGTKMHALTGEKLRAFTLIIPPDSKAIRPVEGQPSLRYLNLIRSGAKEHALPLSYCTYLDSLQPYQVNTLGRKIGRYANFGFFPIFAVTFFIARFVALTDGTHPDWLLAFRKGVAHTVWFMHDWVLKPLFGCGEMSGQVSESGSFESGKEKKE